MLAGRSTAGGDGFTSYNAAEAVDVDFNGAVKSYWDKSSWPRWHYQYSEGHPEHDWERDPWLRGGLQAAPLR